MEVRDQGHTYAVKDSGRERVQILQFVQKEQRKEDGPLETMIEGTTNEEVLLVLIDRFQYLNGKLPSRENSLVITKLEEALMWDRKRTADRVARGVEGTINK